jgi:Na+-driven multidrug efflux pump
MQASMAIAGFIYNMILINVSEAAVTANGIYYKFNNFIVMPIFGINNALIPIIGYNLGAKKYQRIKDTIKFGILYSSVILVIGFFIVRIFPGFILDMFNATGELRDIGLVAFRILAFHYLIIAISIPLEGALQALNRNKQALIETIIRLMVIQLPLAYVITLFANAQYNVWYAAVIAEAVACVYVVFVYKNIEFK